MKIRINGSKIKAACIDDGYDFGPEFEDGDDQAVVAVDQLPDNDLEKLEYIDGKVKLKSAADIQALDDDRQKTASLSSTDPGMSRVTEDVADQVAALISVLIQNNVIEAGSVPDLPQAAQDKINERKNIRNN